MGANLRLGAYSNKYGNHQEMFLQLSILCAGEDFFESETLIERDFLGMQNAVGSFEVHSQNGFTQ